MVQGYNGTTVQRCNGKKGSRGMVKRIASSRLEDPLLPLTRNLRYASTSRRSETGFPPKGQEWVYYYLWGVAPDPSYFLYLDIKKVTKERSRLQIILGLLF